MILGDGRFKHRTSDTGVTALSSEPLELQGPQKMHVFKRRKYTIPINLYSKQANQLSNINSGQEMLLHMWTAVHQKILTTI